MTVKAYLSEVNALVNALVNACLSEVNAKSSVEVDSSATESVRWIKGKCNACYQREMCKILVCLIWC